MARIFQRWLWLIPAGLFVVILGLRVFSTPREFGLIHFFLIALLLGILLIRIFGFIHQDKLSRTNQLELGVFLLIASRVILQVSGGMDSQAYPLNYLVFALVVSIVQPREAILLFLFLAFIEAFVLTSARAWSSQFDAFLIHIGTAAGFGLLIGILIQFERRARQKAEAVLRHLKQDALEFRTQESEGPGGQEFRDLPALSRQGRNRVALRSVFRLDDAFLSVLELLKQTLKPHTAALYWSEGTIRGDGGGEGYRLREIISDAEGINPDPILIPGQGLLGLALQDKKILNLGHHRNLSPNLVYYSRAPFIRSLLAAPVQAGERCLGLLVVDSLESGAFGPDQEKVLTRFSEQVKEVFDHALLFQKTLVEASKFKGLTELSHKLNSTLEMQEILNIILRATAPILNYDLAAISLWSEGSGGDEDKRISEVSGLQKIAAASGLWADTLNRTTFTLEGSLVGWVIAQKKYLSIGRLKDRERKTPVFAKKPPLGQAQSLLAYPLMLYDEALGALVFLSEMPEAFSAYDVQVTGLIADMAAASIANARLYQDMEKQAITDGLTGLFNHRHFQERLGEELERTERHPGPLAVVLFDLDHFKAINDRYGHPVGDTVLKSVANLIRESIRKIDLAARYGGEEFVLVLVNTDAAGAFRLAERIRKAAGRIIFSAGKSKGSGGEEFSITLSAGLAAYPVHARRKEDLVEAADQALYQAKANGRNRTVVFKPSLQIKKAHAR
jgi:two-component system cell cycle response regulator